MFNFLRWLGRAKQNPTKPESQRFSNPTQPDPSQPESESSTLSSLQREILRDRSFSIAEAIGREGGTFLRSEDAIPRPLRAIARLNHFLDTHLIDSEGALKPVLQRWLKEDVRFSQNLDLPLVAMAEVLEELRQPPQLYELARQVNVHWGQMYGDRPYFQQPGQPPPPQTAYSHEMLQKALVDLQQQFWREIGLAVWIWALMRSGTREQHPYLFCNFLLQSLLQRHRSN